MSRTENVCFFSIDTTKPCYRRRYHRQLDYTGCCLYIYKIYDGDKFRFNSVASGQATRCSSRGVEKKHHKMNLAIITILLCAAFAVPSCSGNAQIERGIRRFLEQFRLNMPCGVPEHNIPVLAPLRIARNPVDIELGEFVYVYFAAILVGCYRNLSSLILPAVFAVIYSTFMLANWTRTWCAMSDSIWEHCDWTWSCSFHT